jgi:hypothetical protein
VGFGFRVKQLDYDLTPVAGLALVGHHLKCLDPLFKRLDAQFPCRGGLPPSTLIRSYVGLLAQSKSDFDAIEGFRGDRFFKEALGLVGVPSSPTLRQRLDAQAAQWFDFNSQMIEVLLRHSQPDYGLLPCGYLPLDIDTFAMDNSGTVKDGVSRTYAGVDGYCPLAAYLGTHGFCLEFALRPGAQHSASETTYNLQTVVPMAQRLSAAGPKAPILVRMDAGFCSAALMAELQRCNTAGAPRVDFLIKWNPRKTDPVEVLQQRERQEGVVWQHPRAGKRVAVWEMPVQVEGMDHLLRRVVRITERTAGARGQQFLVPEIILEGWTTSLPKTLSAEAIIELYAGHATHEQFHAEFKTDLDLERLPSGKFDTNYLVCQLAALTMNVLRLMGQQGLLGPHAPVRHAAKRRRVKTVIQELVIRAARVIQHGGRLWLGLGANDKAAQAFCDLHAQCAASG